MRLEIKNIYKTYSNGVRALDNVSLTIETGMFGLIGPNGAGKSTLMRSIATLQAVDEGSINLGSIDVLEDHESIRRLLGYMPQDFGVYPKVSAYMLLDHFAALKGITNKSERKDVVLEMLKRCNLMEVRNKKLGSFSGGMKQRFGIAQALLGNPKLIIVDEPTAGLDPEERNRFLNLLSEIGENVIIILSTHIVDDVAQVCNSMSIISNGKVRLTCKPQEAIDELSGKIWKKVIEKSELLTYQQHHTVISTRLFAGRTVIHVFSEDQPDASFEEAVPDLKDVYFTTLLKIN